MFRVDNLTGIIESLAQVWGLLALVSAIWIIVGFVQKKELKKKKGPCPPKPANYD